MNTEPSASAKDSRDGIGHSEEHDLPEFANGFATQAATTEGMIDSLKKLGARLQTAIEQREYDARHRMQELTAGQADAALHSGAHSSILHKTQERLHESEERFHCLFSAAATGIAISAPNGGYLQANTAFCRMLGYTEEELRALNFTSLTHPDDLKLNLKLREELLAGQRESFFIEKRYLKRNGDVLWVRQSVSATYSPVGDITALMVIAEDITDRKLAESALRHSEERLRLITDLVPHGIFAKDAAGRHIFANPALAEISGLPIEDILGKDDFDLVADRAQAEAYRADDLAVIQSGSKMVISEEPRTDFSGRTRLLQTIKIPYKVAETGETAVLGVCMDITQRKQAEEVNIRSLALLRATLDSTADGILTVGSDRQILSYNESFEKMLRVPVDALSARDDALAVQCILDQLRKPEEFLAKVRRLDDHPLEESSDVLVFKDDRIFECYSRPMLVKGNPSGRVWSFRDITERKKLEQQFLRAQRMESIGTLAGGVAHDLNNILAPIMMAIEILKIQSDNPQARDILETIEVSAKRGADIVRQVLSFARGLDGQRIEVQPKHLLKDLENIIKDTFPKNIQLQFSIPGDIWTILGDPTQVHQILLNLSVNARDAMPNGGELQIGVENCEVDDHYAAMNTQAEPGRYVKISVTDSGTGIPQEIINKIFEPFFTTKELDKGTGLGLSTVLAIVKSHGGIVNVYSEPGKGTVFKVYLPAAGASSEPSEPPNEQAGIPRGNGETVLLVDDEASIRTITSQTLQAFGYKVVTARDGAEAVAIYAERKNEIAVVLTDMMMPVMDGRNLFRVLTLINPAVKIVAASGLASNGSGNRSQEFGIKHFLMKPYSAETLLKTMRLILEEA